VGSGMGKAAEIPDAIRKGIEDAKKNLIKVPIVNTTIPHEVIGEFGAGKGPVRAFGIGRYKRYQNKIFGFKQPDKHGSCNYRRALSTEDCRRRNIRLGGNSGVRSISKLNESQTATPQIRGMIKKVEHVLSVEEI